MHAGDLELYPVAARPTHIYTEYYTLQGSQCRDQAYNTRPVRSAQTGVPLGVDVDDNSHIILDQVSLQFLSLHF